MSKGGALDVQVGGGHYKGFAIQPVEFFHANNVPFLEGNIIKYAMRHKQKNGVEDLKKSRHYCDLTIQLNYPEEWAKMQAEEAKKFEAAVQAEVKKRLDVINTLHEIELDLTGQASETEALKEELKEEPVYEIEIGKFEVNEEALEKVVPLSEVFHKNHGRDAGFKVEKFVSAEPFINECTPPKEERGFDVNATDVHVPSVEEYEQDPSRFEKKRKKEKRQWDGQPYP